MKKQEPTMLLHRNLLLFKAGLFIILCSSLVTSVEVAAASEWPIINSGFERGTAGWELAGGWADGPSGFINVTNSNVHSGNYSMEISSTVNQQAYFYQEIDFPNNSYSFSFWLFRASPNSHTACYLGKDWDLSTIRIASSLVIVGDRIELNAWDAPYAPGGQMYSYNVTAGSWHNMTFVANAISKTQEFYVDGNLIAKLNSSSGSVFNPEILIFGDVNNKECNGLFYFDDFELKTLETTTTPEPSPTPSDTTTPEPSPTLPTPILTISCRSSTSNSGFNVQFLGSLTFNGTGISEAPVLLSYSVTGGKSWIDLTLVYTGSNGTYSGAWLPSATGNWMLKAVFEGNDNYSNASTIVNFAVASFAEQSSFSVASNSTISELSFNSNNNELSFGVSGLSGTTGYVSVYISKSLIGNISSLKVYIDGNQTEYTAASQSDGWLIYFIYQHSTHVVTINAGSFAQTTENPFANWMVYVIPLASVIIVIGVGLSLKRRKSIKGDAAPLVTMKFL